MALVIVHRESGIFLGHALGLSFWSKLECVGQPSAPTFETQKEIDEFVASWPPMLIGPGDLEFKMVTPDDGTFASVQACVDAGLEPWMDELTPVANEQPC